MQAAVAVTLAENDLHRIEAALLDALLDVQPDHTNALDRLLSDPAFSGREQVKQFLVAAVSDINPERNRVLDRILDKITVTASAA